MLFLFTLILLFDAGLVLAMIKYWKNLGFILFDTIWKHHYFYLIPTMPAFLFFLFVRAKNKTVRIPQLALLENQVYLQQRTRWRQDFFFFFFFNVKLFDTKHVKIRQLKRIQYEPK